MNTREQELLDYIKNSAEINELKESIRKLELDLDSIEKAEEAGYFKNTVLDLLATEAHNLRIRLLGQKVKLNTIERKVLQFELAAELRD